MTIEDYRWGPRNQEEMDFGIQNAVGSCGPLEHRGLQSFDPWQNKTLGCHILSTYTRIHCGLYKSRLCNRLKAREGIIWLANV